jgi:hypothetical protein
MTAVVAVEAVAIVLLAVLVGGLLRSHADILRALHQLGVDLTPGSHGRPALDTPVAMGPAPTRPGVSGEVAADITGVSWRDEMMHIAVAGTRHDTLLAFLTSGCATCLTFWEEFARAGLAVPGGARLVVVVHSPSEESMSRIRTLAPPDIPVVMSSQAWADYGVEVAPSFVYVSAPDGRVTGEGVAATWAEIVSLCEQARADGSDRPPSARRRRDTGAAREARADEELMAAGIAPGDPRLYPTRLGDDQVADPE